MNLIKNETPVEPVSFSGAKMQHGLAWPCVYKDLYSGEAHVTEENGNHIMHCRICGESFPCMDVFAVHVQMEHSELYVSGKSNQHPDNQTHINYYDLVRTIKMEKETEVKIEREDTFPLEMSDYTCEMANEDNNDSIIKLENNPLSMKTEMEGRDKQDVIFRIKLDREMQSEYNSANILDVHQNRNNSAYMSQGQPLAMTTVTEKRRIKEFEGNMKKTTANFGEGIMSEKAYIQTDMKNCFKTDIAIRGVKQQLCCDICEFKCDFKNILSRHIKIHMEDEPLSCKFCDFKCKAKYRLALHMRKHGEKPFACSSCDYKSNFKNNFLRHMKIHSGDKPFACHICNYKSIQKSDLENHLRTHTGSKPYACHMCDYKSSLKHSLTLHIRRHTGERPLSCNVCEYKCSRHGDLKIHITTHSVEKRFVCDICDYKCSIKKYLRIHIRKHIWPKNKPDDEKLSCDKCSYKGSNRYNLSRHKKKKHPTPCRSPACKGKSSLNRCSYTR